MTEWTEFILLSIGSRRQWQNIYGNEFASSIKGEEFLHQLTSAFQLLKDVSAPSNV